MGKNNPKAVCIFGANYLLTQVKSLETDFDGALRSQDIEYVHRLRVASRRMRNGFQIFNDCLPPKKAKAWQDKIRQITHTLGAARDLDIQITLLNQLIEDGLDEKFKPGYRRLRLRLKQSRTKAQEKINQLILEMREDGLLMQIHKRLEKMAAGVENAYLFTPSLYQKAFSQIDSALSDFLSYQDAIQEPENIQKLHAMRIAGKHLRYTLEIFAPIYNQALIPHLQVMKDVQDQLGEIHDDDVWIEWLPKFIAKEQTRIETYLGHTGPLKKLLPGFNNLIEDRKFSRDKKYRLFLLTWETLQNENVWEELKEIINTPINVESALEHLAISRNQAQIESEENNPFVKEPPSSDEDHQETPDDVTETQKGEEAEGHS